MYPIHRQIRDVFSVQGRLGKCTRRICRITIPSISIAAAVSACTFLSKTNFYNTHFGNSFLWLFSSTFIALHFFLLSFHNRLKKPKLLHGGFGKYIATPVLFFATCYLHFTPDKSLTGLLFVISLWVDVIAIVQIIRPLTEPKLLQTQLMMAIVSRSMDLYSFTSTYWLIMLFCTIVHYASNIYKDDRVAVSSQIMEGDTKKDA